MELSSPAKARKHHLLYPLSFASNTKFILLLSHKHPFLFFSCNYFPPSCSHSMKLFYFKYYVVQQFKCATSLLCDERISGGASKPLGCIDCFPRLDWINSILGCRFVTLSTLHRSWAKREIRNRQRVSCHCWLDDRILMAFNRTFGQVLPFGQGTRLPCSFSLQAYSAQQKVWVPWKGSCTHRSVCCTRWLVSVVVVKWKSRDRWSNGGMK